MDIKGLIKINSIIDINFENKNNWVKILFLLNVNNNQEIELPFILKNEEELSTTNKYGYINQVWNTIWADDIENTPNYFKKAIRNKVELFDYTYRIGIKGELYLIGFLKNIYYQYINQNKYNKGFQIIPNYNNIFNGDYLKFKNILNHHFNPFWAYCYIDENNNLKLNPYYFDQSKEIVDEIYKLINEIMIETEDLSNIEYLISGYKDVKYSPLLKNLLDSSGQININLENNYPYIGFLKTFDTKYKKKRTIDGPDY